MCEARSSPSCTISSARSVSPRFDPARGGESAIEARSRRSRSDLTSDCLTRAAPTIRSPTIRFASAPRWPSGQLRPPRVTERSSCSSGDRGFASCASIDTRGPLRAAAPSRALRHGLFALGADRMRGSCGCSPAAANSRPRDAPLRRTRSHAASVLAKISPGAPPATPARSRRRPPPICIRQEESTACNLGPGGLDRAHLVCEHRRRDVRILDRERAAEATAPLRIVERDQR